MAAKDRVQLNIRLEQDLAVRLRMVAAIEDENVSEVVRQAILARLRLYNEDPTFRAKRDEWLSTVTGDWVDE